MSTRNPRSETLSLPSGWSGTKTRAYDYVGRLTSDSSTQNGGYSEGFAWDAASNPTTYASRSCAYNSDNQVTTSGTTYDGNGSPTDYFGTAAGFDPEARMTSYGSNWTAGYRADGLRAWKKNGSAKTYFYYDGGTPILEANPSGAITATNVYRPGGLVGRQVGSTDTYYQFDPQGNVSVRSNSSGVATNECFTSAIGNASEYPSNASDPFGFRA